MQTALLAALAASLLLAGCTATGQEDPFAYTRKPLYAGGFNLEKLAGASETQEFRVTDGSIASVRMLVFVNATAGGATVTLTDPAGKTVLVTSETTERATALNLGAWKARVDVQQGSAGLVHVLVVRG